jgi:hypothetical protein
VTDWRLYLACDGCHALQSQACYDLTSGGPEALPPVLREVPHRARKLSAAKSGAAIATPVAKRPVRSQPQRRAATRTAGKVKGWQAIADRQRAKRETGHA